MIDRAKFSQRSLVVALAVMALAPLPAVVVASGSVTLPAPSSDSFSRGFSRGKTVYMERVACASCPAANGANNADEARALMERLDGDEFKLSVRQQRAVKSYLTRRFGIKG